MNNINITLGMTEEDRARFDAQMAVMELIAERLDKLAKLMAAPTVTCDLPLPGQVTIEELVNTPDTVAEQPQEAPQEVVEEQTPPAEEIVQDEPVECDEAAPVPTVTKQDILQKVVALCGAGKKAEAKDIITTYADSVSDLPDSALVEVWDKLTALEG